MKNPIPWSLRGIGPFLNTYGDSILFRAVRNTPPFEINPEAATGIHTIVPHRNRYAYLIALKSFLRYSRDVAVYAHDDGSLTDDDKELLKRHIQGIHIFVRAEADEYFDKKIKDPFLSKVRKSYTSYLKLFDPTFRSDRKRIILLDSDTLFIKFPQRVIDWTQAGGPAWYHAAPLGDMKNVKDNKKPTTPKDQHIQTLIMEQLDQINHDLNGTYQLKQGFCAGFVGYDIDTIDFGRLKKLLNNLYSRFGDKIFKWGAEQTIHGLLLCGSGAERLPLEDYFVHTHRNSSQVNKATFVHFVGESRFFRMRYPRLASKVIKKISTSDC